MTLEVDDQDAVEKLTSAVPGVGSPGTGGADAGALPAGSVTLSSPNFLSKKSRYWLAISMVVLGALTIGLGAALFLSVHSDTGDNWVWPVQITLLIGFAAWFLAYLTVAGFGNVSLSIGAAKESESPTAAGAPTPDPDDGAKDVPVDTSVTVTFATTMDADTIDETNFILVDAQKTPVAATVTFDVASKVATLNPTSDLTPGIEYTASLSDKIEDKDGKAQKAFSWKFTTKP